jgi:hypothetical protein
MCCLVVIRMAVARFRMFEYGAGERSELDHRRQDKSRKVRAVGWLEERAHSEHSVYFSTLNLLILATV